MSKMGERGRPEEGPGPVSLEQDRSRNLRWVRRSQYKGTGWRPGEADFETVASDGDWQGQTVEVVHSTDWTVPHTWYEQGGRAACLGCPVPGHKLKRMTCVGENGEDLPTGFLECEACLGLAVEPEEIGPMDELNLPETGIINGEVAAEVAYILAKYGTRTNDVKRIGEAGATEEGDDDGSQTQQQGRDPTE